MIEVILFDFGQTLVDSSEGYRTALAHRNLADGIKDRKFYRVGVIGRESKRPQNLAAILDVGGRGCASSVREAVWK